MPLAKTGGGRWTDIGKRVGRDGLSIVDGRLSIEEARGDPLTPGPSPQGRGEKTISH
jgi:hypothetical protein